MQSLPPPPSEEARPSQRERRRTGPILELVGGGLAVAGSLLPWVSLTTIFGTLSVAGTEGDGMITAGLGGAICLLAILELAGQGLSRRAMLWVAGATVALAIWEWYTVRDRMADVSSDVARASVGIGLYAIIAGAALAFISALVVED